MTTDSVATLQRYVIHSRQYLENGLLALQNGEAGKAGELLWGSVAQAVHAVAAFRSTSVRTHRELKNFVIQLARDLNDQSIEKDFVIAESLHHNFYEVQQEPVDIAIVVPTVRELVSKLINLIPPEANRQAISPL
jgi:hypothetical protein